MRQPMNVVRYECPACQSVFVPADEITAGAYARCPTCGALSVPVSAGAERTPFPMPPLETVDEDATGPEVPLPSMNGPFSGRGAADEETALEIPLTGGQVEADESPTRAIPTPLFASLLEDSVATGQHPAPELEMPPSTDANQLAEQGGLFGSLLMGDMQPPPVTGVEQAPAYQPPPTFEPPPAYEPPTSMPSAMSALPEGFVMAPPPVGTGEVTTPKGGMDHGAAPALPMPFDVANTAMVMGEVSGGGLPGPPPPPMSNPAMSAPPGTGSGTYLDRETFSDDEFEALVGGSFSPGGGPRQTRESSGPDGWVATNPPQPPPLRRGRGDLPPLPAPPLPRANMEPPANPSALLATLPPIPTVASLGPRPRLMNGVTPLRVGLLLSAALVLGLAAGVAVAPPPAVPPTSGPEGALFKLAQARRLMSQNQNTEAVAMLQAALVMDGSLADAQRDMGVAYARQEKWEEAARAYEAYLQMSPRAPDGPEVDAAIQKYRSEPK